MVSASFNIEVLSTLPPITEFALEDYKRYYNLIS